MLKDFPNITETTEYTDQPKHAHRFDIKLINEALIRQNPRECARNQAVILMTLLQGTRLRVAALIIPVRRSVSITLGLTSSPKHYIFPVLLKSH